ncbi:MAG TPA: taurine catabolism dioxygenase TauD, partial [Cyanobacteria bacterium UBA11049]|nr:taurine catabolism dioxygenase TauD [Cyanobacteria bacterium UBA11049]
MKKEDAQVPSLKKLGTITRKTFKVSQDTLIETEQLLPESSIPLVVKPAIAGVDLLEWAASNKEAIEALLLKHRALLFRNFNVN